MDITTWQSAISAGIEPHVHGGFPSRGLVTAREIIKRAWTLQACVSAGSTHDEGRLD